MTTTINETKVAIGGMLRCCTGTLGRIAAEELERQFEEGEVLQCDHCSSSMILKSGTWHWNRDNE